MAAKAAESGWASLKKFCLLAWLPLCLESYNECLLQKVPYGITSCLGKSRTAPIYEPIVVVVSKMNGQMEILWTSTTKANLNCYPNHGLSKVIFVYSIPMGHDLSNINMKIACNKDIGGILGVKDSMVAHILGKGGSSPCQFASTEARKTARKVKDPKGKAKRGRARSLNNPLDSTLN